ncbi:hypothetical protein KKA14_05380 [bacterium]|nr:hypothetical protein [bacterium]
MPQSSLQSIDEKGRFMLDFLVQHEQEVKRLFSDKELIGTISDPFNIKAERNVTLTNQVDQEIYDNFKNFCKDKNIKVKVALMRAMIDLMRNYKDFSPK